MSNTLTLRKPVFSAFNPRVEFIRRLNGTVEVYRAEPRPPRGGAFQNPDLIRLGMEMCKDYEDSLAFARLTRVFI